MIKNISSLVRYEQIKIENHFYEMLTATVSHEMRTPLNAILTLLMSLMALVQKDSQVAYLLRVI